MYVIIVNVVGVVSVLAICRESTRVGLRVLNSALSGPACSRRFPDSTLRAPALGLGLAVVRGAVESGSPLVG